MQTINNLVSNPGVAVLLGVVVSTFGTTVGSYLTSRLEERRMDREDRRHREQWEREEKERQRQETSASEQEKIALYTDFVIATNVHPSNTPEQANALTRIYFRLAMVASPEISKSARELRLAALDVINADPVRSDEEQMKPLYDSLEAARERFLSAIRDSMSNRA